MMRVWHSSANRIKWTVEDLGRFFRINLFLLFSAQNKINGYQCMKMEDFIAKEIYESMSKDGYPSYSIDKCVGLALERYKFSTSGVKAIQFSLNYARKHLKYTIDKTR